MIETADLDYHCTSIGPYNLRRCNVSHLGHQVDHLEPNPTAFKGNFGDYSYEQVHKLGTWIGNVPGILFSGWS